MKILRNLAFALVAAVSGSPSAQAEEDYDTWERVNEYPTDITCTNDGDGAFSFHMTSFKEPIIQVTKSSYNSDGNNMVVSHLPELSEDTPPLEERTDIKISEAFKETMKNFNGRLLMFFDASTVTGQKQCSIEDWSLSNHTMYRRFVPQTEPETPKGPTP